MPVSCAVSAWALTPSHLRSLRPDSTTTCSTGTPASLRRRPTRSRRSQPARCSGKVETMISSTRSSWTTCIAAVYGSGCATWPCASIPSERSVESASRSRRSASGCSAASGSLCGLTIRNVARPSRGPAPDAVEERRAEHGLVRDHEHVRLARPRRRRRRRRGRRAGRRRPCGSRRAGCACAASRTSPPGASRRSARRLAPGRACPRPRSAGRPRSRCRCAGIPPARSRASVRSSRRPAAARRESS